MLRPTAFFALPILFLALSAELSAQEPSSAGAETRVQEPAKAAPASAQQEVKAALDAKSLEAARADQAIEALKAQSEIEAAKARYAPAHFYRLDFLIQELGADGKPANSRTFTTTTNTRQQGNFDQIRSGAKVPVASAASATAAGSDKSAVQWQYMDVGVNIDLIDTEEIGNKLAFRLSAEVSSLAPAAVNEASLAPIVRQFKWKSRVLIPVGKPTVIFSSDSLDNKGAMQVVVKATPLQ
jgi:hypothetical protein